MTELIIGVLVAMVSVLCWVAYFQGLRIAKLEWWVTSLESRKSDKSSPQIFEGDEWKHGITDDDEAA